MRKRIMAGCMVALLATATGAAEKGGLRPFKKVSGDALKALQQEAADLATKTKKKCVLIPHVKEGPKIDGVLDPIYEKAGKAKLDRNDSGPKDIAEKYPTTVHLLTDPQYLYITYKCGEPSLDPKSYMKAELHKIDFDAKFKRLSKLKERDQAMWDDHIWEDAYVEFLLEPGAKRLPGDYYHLAVNTLCTFYDAKDRDEINWDPQSKAACKRHEGFYVIEVAIPLNDLVPADKPFPKVWAANFLRLRHKVGEMAWSKSWKTHIPKNFGSLIFVLGSIGK